jgi:hypothetical protein
MKAYNKVKANSQIQPTNTGKKIKNKNVQQINNTYLKLLGGKLRKGFSLSNSVSLDANAKKRMG